MKGIKVVFACDHGGFEMKKILMAYAEGLGCIVADAGTFSDESVDYPDFAQKACAMVASGEAERAVLVCGTGIGMSIAANKIKGIRCALCSDATSARLTREHNDANALALGGRVIGPELAKDILSVWLATDFIGSYHTRRVKKVMSFEDSGYEAPQ